MTTIHHTSVSGSIQPESLFPLRLDLRGNTTSFPIIKTVWNYNVSDPRFKSRR